MVIHQPTYGPAVKERALASSNQRNLRARVTRTLQAGRDYPSWVMFVKGPRDTNSYPGSTGLAGYYSRTDFLIRGVNQNDLTPATLVDSTLLPNGHFQFTVVGSPSKTYMLSHTTNFGSWTPYLTNSAPGGGTFNVIDPTLPVSGPRFYRAETTR